MASISPRSTPPSPTNPTSPPFHPTAQVLTIVAVELKCVTAPPGTSEAFEQVKEAIPLCAGIAPKTLKLVVKLVGEEYLQPYPLKTKELLKALGTKEGCGVSVEVRAGRRG